MKITVLCNDRFPSKSAHGVYLAKLCDSFVSQGVETRLVVPKRFNEVSKDPFRYYALRHTFAITKIWSFDFLIFAKYLKGAAYWLQSLNFYLFVFFYFLFGSRAQVIYTMDFFGPLLKFLGYKVVFESHQWLGERKSFFLSSVKQASRFVVTNRFIAEEFIKNGVGKNKILVAPNGVDLKQFLVSLSQEEIRKKYNLPGDRKIVGYIGRYKTMRAEKGVDDLIRAFSKILTTYPKAFLLIVGVEKDEIVEIESVCRRENLPNNSFQIVAHVEQGEVSFYMKACDVFVMNYPWKEHYAYFMSPMKMFEYMASCRPIVASDLPSIKEVLNEKNAVIVAHDNEQSLIAGIEKVLKDETLARNLAERALIDVGELTWDKRALRILRFVAS